MGQCFHFQSLKVTRCNALAGPSFILDL